MTLPKNPPHDALRAAVNRAIASGAPVITEQRAEVDSRVLGQETETPVIFRVAKGREPEGMAAKVTAVFPAEPFSSTGDSTSIYAHIGQHGGCSLSWYRERTRAAKPEEYADLKRELESAPYNYRLKVYSRMTRGHRAAFDAEVKRLRSRS